MKVYYRISSGDKNSVKSHKFMNLCVFTEKKPLIENVRRPIRQFYNLFTLLHHHIHINDHIRRAQPFHVLFKFSVFFWPRGDSILFTYYTPCPFWPLGYCYVNALGEHRARDCSSCLLQRQKGRRPQLGKSETAYCYWYDKISHLWY